MFNVFFFKDGTNRDEDDNSINNTREVENSLVGNSKKTSIDLVIILVV